MCMEITGGREWANLGVSNNVIKDVIVDLSTELAKDLNEVCRETLDKHGLAEREIVVQIGGSVRVMELNPNKFLAGDIDLDWYDSNPDNQPKLSEVSLLKDNISMKCAGEFRKKKSYSKDFGSYSYKAEKTPENWHEENGIKFIKLPVEIKHESKETNGEITVEFKNVTSEIWHQGYKKGKRREINGQRSIWIPDEQLYIYICMRLCEIKENSKEVPMETLADEVTLAVKNKGLFIKKEIMEQCVAKDRIKQLAEDKLEADWYAMLCQVMECKTCEEFVALCNHR